MKNEYNPVPRVRAQHSSRGENAWERILARKTGGAYERTKLMYS